MQSLTIVLIGTALGTSLTLFRRDCIIYWLAKPFSPMAIIWRHLCSNQSPDHRRRIRIALVGCGRISRSHVKAIAAHHERSELVAICDPQPERLKHAQQLIAEAAVDYSCAANNPAQFSSLNQLLEEAQTKGTPVDLVVLATPSGLHPGK